MTCGIYKITNKTNGKAYIGASENIKKRFGNHKYQKGSSMYPIIKKYGKENFTFEILEECSKSKLIDKEKYYIKLHGTKIPNGYNLTDGGEHNYNTTGYLHVRRISDSRLRHGFIWGYYYNDDSGKEKRIFNVDLNLLKDEIINRGLPWEIIDEENAKRSNERNIPKGHYFTNNNRSGFYNVGKFNNENSPQGYYWGYPYDNNKCIRKVDLDDLKKEVLSLGLPWEVIDEEKANKSYELNQRNKSINNQRGNKTGYYRVSKDKNNKYSGGYIWQYRYQENNKKKKIRRVDLNDLKEEVLARGLKWKIIDEEQARISDIENEEVFCIRSNTNTGFYNVSKVNCKRCPKGFKYVYYLNNNGIRRHISSINILNLEKKVKNKGLLWKIIDKKKAKKELNQLTLDLY